MKTKLKKAAVLLLAALFAALSFPAFAADDAPASFEAGFSYRTSVIDGETAVVLATYEGGESEIFVPKTLGGYPLTPAAIRADTFLGCPAGAVFRTDDDNAYFKAEDGALFSKDGKILYRLPVPADTTVVSVPAGVETMADACVLYPAALVVPASVVTVGESGGRLEDTVIAGERGSAAEQWALSHGNRFVSLGQDHEHVFFRDAVVKEATCTESGEARLICPCGETRTVQTDATGHRFRLIFQNGKIGFFCVYCGRSRQEIEGGEDPIVPIVPVDPEEPEVTPETCTCVCHKFSRDPGDLFDTSNGAMGILRDFFYRLRLVYWRLTGTRQYCECGARHY